MANIQTEKAHQKQPTIFRNKKRVLLIENGKEKVNSVWCGDQDDNLEDHCYPPRLPPLHSEGCPDWGHCHGGRVPGFEQDCMIQCAQSQESHWHQELIPEVLR
uniref:Uncharacterized protein n=1 Tax=Ursus americanus TaxID=9643 RepID=A0A452SBS6_URSAM